MHGDVHTLHTAIWKEIPENVLRRLAGVNGFMFFSHETALNTHGCKTRHTFKSLKSRLGHSNTNQRCTKQNNTM